jgi:hypothetical protein
VLLFDGERCLGRFRALNLSGGGVLVAGRAPTHKGGKVIAILEMPTGRPLRAEAVIARERGLEEADAFALAFTKISASGQDALQTAVLTTLEEAREASVLIATVNPGEGIALKRECKRLGRPSFCVDSASEALRFFELQNAVSVALVDAALAEAHAGLVMRQLAETQPRVARVVLTPDASALRVDGDDVLTLPWSADRLRAVLRSGARRSDEARAS